MDRLVKPDVKEVDIEFKRGQKSTTTFRLTNLMHTMSVAVSLTTSDPSRFQFQNQFSILPPLGASSYSLVLSKSSDDPVMTPATVLVRSSMLPTGKASVEELRRLFLKPGKHVFKDASLPISLIGVHVAENLILSKTHVAKIEILIEKAVSGCDSGQITALLRSAVVCGNRKMVGALIGAGGDVNERDKDGRSMVSIAVRTGDLGVLRVLIEAGGTVGPDDLVFHDAAAMNRVDVMMVLRDGVEGIKVGDVDTDGRAPVHVAAGLGHVEAVKFCLDSGAGAGAGAGDRSGWWPVHCAAAGGHRAAVECLLGPSSSGAMAMAKYAVAGDGRTAYDVAVENGHRGLYDVLGLGDALHRAARGGDAPAVRECIAGGAAVDGRDGNGWTALHRAAFKGRVECVRALIELGARVDVVDDEGYAPLHLAVEAGHAQVALALIAVGARAKTEGKSGRCGGSATVRSQDPPVSGSSIL